MKLGVPTKEIISKIFMFFHKTITSKIPIEHSQKGEGVGKELVTTDPKLMTLLSQLRSYPFNFGDHCRGVDKYPLGAPGQQLKEGPQ